MQNLQDFENTSFKCSMENNCLYGRMSLKFFPENLFRFLTVPSCLNEEENASGKENETADNGERVGPAYVVVLPVGHPVAPVASSSEYYDGDYSAN